MPFGRFLTGFFPTTDPHIGIFVSLAIPSKTLLNSLILAAVLSTTNSPITPPSKGEHIHT